MVKSKLFSLSIITLIINQVFVSCDECIQTDNKCRCEYPDGTGFDLSPVVTGDNNFIEAITVQNFAFFFNPCGDTDKLPDRIKINDTDNECKKDKYSVCVYDQVKNKTVVLGRSENVRFQSSENTIDLVYPVKGQLYDDTQKTVISLQCAPNAMSSYLYAPLEPINITGEVNLILFSKSACSKVLTEGHGNFYYFMFFLFVALFLYLSIGMTVNYIFVGARGFELIPNYDFWIKAWKSVKLGFAYVKNGCRVIPTEDSDYDAI